MTSTIEGAVNIAALCHEGLVDKAGQPYIFHLMRVATSVAPEYAIPAVLHDILEDTTATPRLLRLYDVSEEDIRTIERLSRSAGESYAEYIQGIIQSQDQAALEIKMADLQDHLYKNPFPLLSGGQATRYIAALHRINVEYIRRRREARLNAVDLPCQHSRK